MIKLSRRILQNQHSLTFSSTKTYHDKDLAAQSGNKIYHFIDYYRKYGHLQAQLDPLQLVKSTEQFLELKDFGLSHNSDIGSDELIHDQHNVQDIQSLEKYLAELYTGRVGVEFNHIENSEEKKWLYENYERFMLQKTTNSERVNIHNLLIQGEAIDHYMHRKFTTFKRYSGEGGEGAIISLRAIYAQASEQGITDVVQVMAHRGRFVQMITLLDFPASHIFRKIAGKADIPEEYTSGLCDVVHHLSSSSSKTFHGTGSKEKEITISVVHNPSHLEAANPVSQGKTKAKQDDYGNQEQVLNLQLHGDAAFAAQGVVYESLQISTVQNYSVGGTVHVVLNNQIGYTTNVNDSRGTRYCTDILKGFSMPIIHVNSEDVESVHKVSKFLVAYRQKFKKDIALDLITYRRYGHNEVDEPEFTQPLMYKQIRQIEKGLPFKYSQQLLQEGLVKEHDVEKIKERVNQHLDKEYIKSQTEKSTIKTITDSSNKGSRAFTHKWKDMQLSQFALDEHYLKNTGKDMTLLKTLAEQSVTLKPDFKVHPRIQKYFIEDRLQQLKNNEFDWATGETMAVSSLLQEGYNIRMSGEDVERGTFSQRHWVMVDQNNESQLSPIQQHSSKNSGRFQVCNSPLSEAAVIGFDFGYAMESPKNLVLWEAQFGDFYNTGQFMVDTFITCSEEKWMRQASLVMLLPHGYDGNGPEHSSCRIERWLQMGVDLPVNFQLINPSTPANVFHMLRRQMLRSYRKPLIVASAKILLKHKNARSYFKDIGPNTEFQPIIVKKQSTEAKNILLCSGKISYDLEALFEENKIKDFSLITIEELLPFPSQHLKQALSKMNTKANIFWVQEEPMNAGAYRYAQIYLKQLGVELNYIGRPSIASVAAGYTKLHSKEGQDLLDHALQVVKS